MKEKEVVEENEEEEEGISKNPDIHTYIHTSGQDKQTDIVKFKTENTFLALHAGCALRARGGLVQ